MHWRGYACVVLAVAVGLAVLAWWTAQPAPPLRILLVPHSHCDPGWKTTYDDYFYTEVEKILDATVAALLRDPQRRFIWSEIAYFRRWWEQQSPAVITAFRGLVARGQIEFVGGGWVQNDEALTYYPSVIDQLTIGRAFLRRELGVVPRVAWQIDPFGHSAVTPLVMRGMGVTTLVLNRLHYAVKSALRSAKAMEFLWDFDDNGETMFSHVLYDHYNAPMLLDVESSKSKMDLPLTPVLSRQFAGAYATHHDEIKDRARLLLHIAQRTAAVHTPYGENATRVAMIPMGNDFRYRAAEQQFAFMESLMTAMREEQPAVEIQYATLSDYFAYAHASAVSVPVFRGDFLPYAESSNDVWTGFYTQRMILKSLLRVSEARVRAAEFIFALGTDLLSSLRHAELAHEFQFAQQNVGLLQHHDGITGTSQRLVVDDYATRLRQAKSAADKIISLLLPMFLQARAPGVVTSSPLLTIADSLLPEAPKYLPVIVFNPLAWPRTVTFTRDITTPGATVYDSAENKLPASVTHPHKTAWMSEDDPQHYPLHISVTVPPLGAITVFVLGAPSSFEPPEKIAAHLMRWTASVKGVTAEVTRRRFAISFGEGENRVVAIMESVLYKAPRSGAYVFRPKSSTALEEWHVAGFDDQKAAITFQLRNDHIEVNVTLNRHGEDSGWVAIETRTVVDFNLEVALRFTTGWADTLFLTDNGLDLMPRQPHAAALDEERVFPTPVGCVLRDQQSNNELVVLTREPRGVASMMMGTVELFLHRHVSIDDEKGLEELPEDASTVRGSMLVYLGPALSRVDMMRATLQHQNPPVVLIGDPVLSISQYTKQYSSSWQPLAASMAKHVHLLSLSSEKDALFMRLQNLARNDASVTVPVTVDIERLFSGFEVTSYQQTLLDGNDCDGCGQHTGLEAVSMDSAIVALRVERQATVGRAAVVEPDWTVEATHLEQLTPAVRSSSAGTRAGQISLGPTWTELSFGVALTVAGAWSLYWVYLKVGVGRLRFRQKASAA